LRDDISKGPLRDFKTGTGFAGAEAVRDPFTALALLASVRMTQKNDGTGVANAGICIPAP